jgi:hypothetical protein
MRLANVRAGLSPEGVAAYEYPSGRGVYDPRDPADVERVRALDACTAAVP